VQAQDFGSAVMLAGLMSLNPGGECVGLEIPDYIVPDASWRNRLLTKAETLALNDIMDAAA